MLSLTKEHSIAASYRLEVELDLIARSKIAVVLYAKDANGNRTGLMNTNFLGRYIDSNLIPEDSTDPIITGEEEASWLIFAVLKDWKQWERFLNYDLAGQDIG